MADSGTLLTGAKKPMSSKALTKLQKEVEVAQKIAKEGAKIDSKLLKLEFNV